jgi:hypothetical protein
VKSFGIVVNLGGRSRRVKDSARKITYAKGTIFGLTEYYGPRHNKTTGCKVWIYSRQSKRELADTFFHEMTHVFLHMIGGVEKQGDKEEFVARWIGYLAKLNLADYSNEFRRDFRMSRRYL